jgi:nitrogen-specific signal transduction histidine kinase
MQQSNRDNYQLECPLAHELINKLSVIVGNCDLLAEKTPQDSPLFERMLLIRDMARSVAKDLGQIECDLVRLRATNNHKAPTS